MSAGSAADPRGYELSLDRDERALLGLARPGDPLLPQEPPDWDAVAAMARVHRMEARLHRALEAAAPPAGPPQAVREAWRRQYFAGLHAAVERLEQRDRAVRALSEAGLRPMVVKGAALAGALYPDPAVRPMEDIDLLIPPGSMPRLAELSDGMAAQGIELHLFEIEDDHHDLTMDGAYRLDVGRLWSEARPATFAGGAALVPSLEDQLLMVCVSCCRNSFWNLVTVVDAAEIVHRHGAEIDWGRVARLAREQQLEVALDTLLALVGMLFGVAAPAGARDGLAPSAWRRRLIDRLLRGYRLHEGGGLEAVNIRRPIGVFALKYAVNRPRVLARQARAVLLPNWRWMRAHYPDAGRGEILLRYAAHPFVVLALALRLARRRGSPPAADRS